MSSLPPEMQRGARFAGMLAIFALLGALVDCLDVVSTLGFLGPGAFFTSACPQPVPVRFPDGITVHVPHAPQRDEVQPGF